MTLAAVGTEQGYELTQTGVRFLRPLTLPEYEALGRRLSNFVDRSKWALGDWLAAGEGITGLGDRFELAMRVTGRTYETLRSYLVIALSFSHDERSLMPWAFYRAVQRLPAKQRFTAIELSHQNSWTRRDLDVFIASRMGEDAGAIAASTSTKVRTGARSRRPRPLTCPHCGKSFVPGQPPQLEDPSTWGGDGKVGA